MSAAPSNANTSGLGVVAWRSTWTGLSGQPVHELHQQEVEAIRSAKWMESATYEPLVTAASAQARIDGQDRRIKALEKLGVEQSLRAMQQATRAKDAETRATEAEDRADRLAKALEALQDLFAREGECSMERFERIAEMFRKDTGYLAPGKDPGMLSQQPEGDELRRIYDDWYAGKIKTARAALQQETQL